MKNFIKTLLIFMTIFLLGDMANAGQIGVDTVGCREKRDLWVVLDHHDKSTTQAFINTGACTILREGDKVKAIKNERFLSYSFSQVRASGKILWVISDFLR